MTTSSSKSRHCQILKKYDQALGRLLMQKEKVQNYSKDFSFDLFSFEHIPIARFALD